ncbi:MAG: RidA family protein [Clostridiales bacterium]|nr:RidA family protein [Clostridiales bacterium]
MKTLVNTEKAPKAIGPYSQGMIVNGFLYTSGQIAIDPITGNIVNGGIEEQTHRVFKNLEAILSEAGCTFDNIIKTTVFIRNMGDFNKVNEIYGLYIKPVYPARSCIEVSNLPKNALIEIEAICEIK